MADPETNKQTMLAYYNMAFNEKRPAEAVEKYGGSHHIQHNPQAADGFEAFVQFVEGFTTRVPQLSADIKRAVAEGDLVVTHSLLKTSPEDRGSAAADFFRLEDGGIVEHWDVWKVSSRRFVLSNGDERDTDAKPPLTPKIPAARDRTATGLIRAGTQRTQISSGTPKSA
jgi:predicted SnoaL-like aldol condensation-catalyzing enzyme